MGCPILAAILVLVVGFLPIPAQAVLVGPAPIAGAQAVLDERAGHQLSVAAEG